MARKICRGSYLEVDRGLAGTLQPCPTCQKRVRITVDGLPYRHNAPVGLSQSNKEDTDANRA